MVLDRGPSGTGPDGFSRCMIDAEQNRDGGNAFNRFSMDNRVLDGDPFRVWIVE